MGLYQTPHRQGKLRRIGPAGPSLAAAGAPSRPARA